MSNQLETIGNQNLAAIFGNAVAEQNINDLFSAGVNTSEYLPTISIRSREFRTVVNGEENRLQDRHLDVILISARPNLSKTYYPGGYSPGSKEKPVCGSSDGTYPDAGVQEKQSANCQICPKNAWGSKVSPGGKEAKACSDYRLIVVAMAANPEMLFQVRIPATSLKPLATYGKKCSMMGVPLDGAITRLSFTDAEYPQLEFTMVDTVKSAGEYAQIKELAKRDEVQATISVRQNAPVQIQPAPVQHASQQPVAIPQYTAKVPAVETQSPQVVNADPVPSFAPADSGDKPMNMAAILEKWKPKSS